MIMINQSSESNFSLKAPTKTTYDQSTTLNMNHENSTILSQLNISDIMQKKKIASDIMSLESQEFIRKFSEKKTRIKDFKDKAKDFREFANNNFAQNNEREEKKNLGFLDGEINFSQKEEKKHKLTNLLILENSLSSLKKKLVFAKSSKNLLQSRLINIKKQRKIYFPKTKEKNQSNLKNNLTFLLNEFNQENCRHTKNSKKIEKSLLSFFDLITNVGVEEMDVVEEYILKKNKTQEDAFVSKTIKTYGYKHSDFHKIKKYKPDAFALPILTEYFDENKLKMLPNGAPNVQSFEFNKNGQRTFKNFLKPTNKSILPHQNDPDYHILSLEAHIPIRMIDGKQEVFTTYDEIPRNEVEKELAVQKMKKMRPEELEKHAKQTLKRAWQNVVRNVIRIYRFAQKDRMEREQNCRKYAILCCKEVRKKYVKSQRMHREYQFRAKRMQREMLVYWRKRERELNEIKKRKEKLESELKRREEEERESLLQKKRLEFLMKQSDIYAHFMARKLGIAIHSENQEGLPQNPNALEEKKDPLNKEFEIDENAALENIHMMINEQRENLLIFDKETRMTAGLPMVPGNHYEQLTLDEVKNAQTLDFSYVPQDTFNEIINTPQTFIGDLKEYQLKGLRWLDNLYDQGINGILADEMGLGKTIQAIALLAHISENKHNYGPFLIVAPSSTLYNWQQEIKRFCPTLKVLPYWGNLKQRKTLRKFLSLKSLGSPHSPFHIVITSYQLIVADEKTFQRMKWQYVILDEAQAIKNINSQRWKTLLSFNSRNKLLLTGTPIQNTMAELWALLHFIMPKLFDSHEQFQEWFSKDIEAHSQDQKAVNQHQLSRLHAILKPFMLRRVKKDVEHEIGQKKEFQILCEMTKRQQELYDNIKKRLSIKDFFQMFESKAKVESLMNLVMQFRKVCNHPELFERRPCRSPFFFHTFYYYTGNMPVLFGQLKEITFKNHNPINLNLSKLIYDDCISQTTLKKKFIIDNLCIWSANYINSQIRLNNNQFCFMRFLGLSPGLMETLYLTDEWYLSVLLMHFMMVLSRRNTLFNEMPKKYCFWINQTLLTTPDYYSNSINKIQLNQLKNLEQITDTLMSYDHKKILVYAPKVLAPPIQFHCPSSNFIQSFNSEKNQKLGKILLFGENFSIYSNPFEQNPIRIHSSISYLKYPYNSLFPYEGMSLYPAKFHENLSKIEIPDFISLIADSAKLNFLDKTLSRLKKNNHRVLIFCQMTKMMDILEDYLLRKKYQFFRLDGSCNIADRRDMVQEFQTNPRIFAFLLSTRAGGLGVTLTAADTVIFYDNDWNPTMDAQATDRAHRIGQTKEVHVFRLVTKGTIEERILKRAQQKQTVQATVYSGGAFKADIFKPQEVMELLFDESEIEVNETNKFMNRGGKRFKGRKKENNNNNSKNNVHNHGKEKSGRSSGRARKNEQDLKVNTNKNASNTIEEEKNPEEKENIEIEMDFSPLMMNNNEMEEDVSNNNYE